MSDDSDDVSTLPPGAAPAPVPDTRGDSHAPADAPAPPSTPALVDPWPHFPELIRKRYERGGLLGRGGMGVVFEATDTVLGRKVAIKGPVRHFGGNNELLRVYTARELRFMARLGHPNILPVYDVWEDTFGNPWCAMLRVAGAAPTLKKRLEDLAAVEDFAQRPFAELIQVFLQICRGVAFAHTQGVIHRDLKPDNVLLGPAGEALVGDWGIAAELAEVWPEASGLAGTPGYGAPEQLGQAGIPRADQRSDVHALGVILRELVGARHVPRELASVVQKATSVDAAARHPDLPALIADIDAYLKGGLLQGVEYSFRERVTKWVRRYPGRTGALAAVGVGVLALAIAVPLLVRSEGTARTAQKRAEAEARRSEIKFRVARAAQTAAGTPERAILDVILAAQASLQSGEPVLTEVTGACFDALAAAGIDRALDTGASTEEVLDYDHPPLCLAFSPDGKLLATGHPAGVVRLWTGALEVDEGKFEGHRGTVRTLAFRPDGRGLATGSDDGTVGLWSVDGTRRTTFSTGQGFVTAVAFRPDGQLAVGGSDGSIRFRDADGRPVGEPLRGHQRTVRALAFHPGGALLASASDDVTVRIWSLDGARGGLALAGHTGPVNALAMSPDGRLLASGSEDRTVRLWNLDGTPHGIPFQGHTSAIHALAFSPDGQTVASGSADRTIRLWDLEGLPRGAPIAGHQGTVTGLAYQPDGTVLASCASDRRIRLWHADWTQALDLLCTRMASSADASDFIRGRAMSYDRIRKLRIRGKGLKILDLSSLPAGLAVAAGGHAVARTPATTGVVVAGGVTLRRDDLRLPPSLAEAVSLIANRQIDAPPRDRLLDAGVAGLEAALDGAGELDVERSFIEGMLGTLGYRAAYYYPARFPPGELPAGPGPRPVAVRARMLADALGYVHVTRFNPFTAPDLARALDLLAKPRALRALVLDCRTALDGPLDAAVETARVLLGPGEIVRVRSRTGPEQVLTAPGSPLARLPLAVLVGKRSCGAAEVVAAAVQHHRRGAVIGQTTPGLIRPRTDHPLPGGSLLRLTTQEWLTPGGTRLRDHGVQPDQVIAHQSGTQAEQDELDAWRDAAWEQADALLPATGTAPVGVPALDATLRAAVASFSTTLTAVAAPSLPRTVPATADTLEIGPPEARHQMVRIPAGSFLMGDDGPAGQELRHHIMVAAPIGQRQNRASDESNDEAPAHRVWLDDFFIDRHAVTNRQFRAFVAATGHPWSARHWNDPALAGDDEPVVMVSFDDASAYCRWVGLRLPTEAEREKAERGGLQAMRYPWGDEPPAGRARFGVPDDPRGAARVMTFPPNGFGLYDMAGGVYEWCADWYGADYYAASDARNPTGPATGQSRVLRGAAWKLGSDEIGCAKRSRRAPDQRDEYIGFRCAR